MSVTVLQGHVHVSFEPWGIGVSTFLATRFPKWLPWPFHCSGCQHLSNFVDFMGFILLWFVRSFQQGEVKKAVTTCSSLPQQTSQLTWPELGHSHCWDKGLKRCAASRTTYSYGILKLSRVPSPRVPFTANTWVVETLLREGHGKCIPSKWSACS